MRCDVADLLHTLLEPNPDEILSSAAAWLGLTVLCGALSAAAYWLTSRCAGPLLPPQRNRAVPWNGVAVIGAWIIYAFAPALVADGLVSVAHPLFRSLYGPEFPNQVRNVGGAVPRELHLEAQRRLHLFWAAPLACPWVVIGVLYLLRQVSDARAYQLGWTTHRWGRNLLLGALACLALTPAVYMVEVLVNYVYMVWCAGPEQPHALTELAGKGLLDIEYVLFVLTAFIAAPVMEELLCRGVLQPWAESQPYRADIVMGVSLPLAVFQHSAGLGQALRARDWFGVGLELQPAAFVLVMLIGYSCLRALRKRAWCAIYASALLFGTVHANWPTPVPLFVLALGLGWLAYRTRSLVGPIVLHALFNGVACVGVFLGQGAAPESNGRETTSAERFSPSAATVTAVPGSQLPRRIYASAIAPNRGDTTDDVTWPTSSASRNTLVPDGTADEPAIFRPRKRRLTWPRSRAMTIGSWPR